MGMDNHTPPPKPNVLDKEEEEIQVLVIFALLEVSEENVMDSKNLYLLSFNFFITFFISTITLSNNLIQPVSAASCSSSNREPVWGIEAANISIQDYNWWGKRRIYR